MKALLIKDIKTIFAFFIFIAIFGFATSFAETTSFISFVYVFLIPMTIMNQDELTHFNRLASMMPISNAEAVCEKYVISLIGLAVALVFGAAGMAFGYYVMGININIDSLFLPTCLVLFYCAITLPLDFLVTSQIGRTIMLVASMIVVGIIFGIVMALGNEMFVTLFNGGLTWGIRIVLLAVCTVLFAASIPLSISIYRRKDK